MLIKVNKKSDGILRRDTGSVMLEFAVVLPLIVLFACAGIEFSRATQYIEFSILASREVALNVYRNCLFDPRINPRVPGEEPHADDVAWINSCSSERATEIVNRLTSLNKFKGVEARATIFYYDTKLDKFHTYPATLPSGGNYGTTFNANVPGQPKLVKVEHTDRETVILNNQADLSERRDRVVVGEVYVPFDSILGRLLMLFNFVPRGFYDATVL